jgi:membrane protein DedA with SNARE-associated domain
MSVEQLISTYGYLAVLVGTFLEGETILVIAGFMAHRGYLRLLGVILAAFAGTLCSDQLFFLLGRRHGQRFLDRRPAWQPRAETVRRLLDRHPVAVTLGFRFLYGVRNVTPLIIGASGFSPRRFFVLNIAGAALWAAVVATLGYLLGHTIEVLLEDARKYEQIVIGALIAAGVGLWCWKRWRNRHHRSSERST